MKERFLNIFLFLISIAFIAGGIISIFFYNQNFMVFVKDHFVSAFKDSKLAIFFLQMIGSFVFSWGMFFFLMTVFTVMDLKSTTVYGYIFWVYTFWALSFGYVSYINKYMFFVILLGGLYGLVFLIFLISLLLKSKNKSDSKVNTAG
jgi:hypothetical protein